MQTRSVSFSMMKLRHNCRQGVTRTTRVAFIGTSPCAQLVIDVERS